jgi:hypothetical protein
MTDKFRYKISMSRIINTKWLILITLTVLCAYAAEQPYRKIIHNSDPKAKCLDGSSPAIYLHEGGDKKNFLIFFNGGGYCAGANLQQTLENCYLRSKTELGTSKVLPETLTIPGGYLSTDPALSKFAVTRMLSSILEELIILDLTLNGFKPLMILRMLKRYFLLEPLQEVLLPIFGQTTLEVS